MVREERRDVPKVPTYICPNLLGVGERLYVTQARKALGRAQLPNLSPLREQLWNEHLEAHKIGAAPLQYGAEEWNLDFQAMIYDKFPDYCYECLNHHSGFVTSGTCLKCITAQVYKPGMIDLSALN